MAANFKTRLFGGFDREDVIAFIEKTARENRELTERLTAENAALKKANASLTEELDALRKTFAQNAQEASLYEQARNRAETLAQQAQELSAENETLRAAAEEYRALKDHIAEIEISAHRRTEEFRAAAVARLHELVAQQRNWCAGQRAQYAALHQQLRDQIRAAQDTLGEADLSGFRQMEEQLQQLDRDLDE